MFRFKIPFYEEGMKLVRIFIKQNDEEINLTELDDNIQSNPEDQTAYLDFILHRMDAPCIAEYV